MTKKQVALLISAILVPGGVILLIIYAIKQLYERRGKNV